MPDKPPRFHVIHGTRAPDTPKVRLCKRIRAIPKPPSMLQCRRCGGRTLIEIKTGVEIYRGKARGGTKQLIWALCLVQGETIVVY